MPIINGIKRYSAVSVVQVTLGHNQRHKKNRDNLGRAWQHYGYNVQNVDQRTLGLVRNNLAASDRAARDWFTSFMDDEEEAQRSLPDDDRLLVVCYFGHGGTLPANQQNNWDYKHLIATGPRGHWMFDMSKIQESFRDEIGYDVLFVLECCHAMLPGMELLEERPWNYNSPDWKTMETLGAGLHLIMAPDHGMLAFSRRFAANLMAYSDRSVLDRAADIEARTRAQWEAAPVEHRRESGSGKIYLTKL